MIQTPEEDVLATTFDDEGREHGHNNNVNEEDNDDSLAARARAFLVRKKKKEIEHLERTALEETKEMQDRPSINPNSARIASELGRNEAFVGYSLYAHASLQRELRDELQKDWQEEHDNVPIPAITKQAADLIREGHVSDRLYQEFVQKSLKKKDQKEKQSKIDRSRRKSRSALKHSERLYEQASKNKAALAEKQREKEMLQLKRAKPKLNPNTKKIVASMNQSSKDRLMKPRRSTERRRLHEMYENLKKSENTPSFKPSISSKSKQLANDVRRRESEQSSIQGECTDGENINQNNTHERLYKESKSRAQKQEMRIAEKEIREENQPDCTFKPKITKYESQVENCKERVEDRLAEWNSYRNSKLDHLMKTKEREENEMLPIECTFKPKTNVDRKLKASPTNRSISTANSVDAFVARQIRARQEKERIEKLQNGVGSRWSYKATVPKAPNLGTDERIKAREMRRKSANDIALAEKVLLSQKLRKDKPKMIATGKKNNRPIHKKQMDSPPPPPPPPASNLKESYEDNVSDRNKCLNKRIENHTQSLPRHQKNGIQDSQVQKKQHMGQKSKPDPSRHAAALENHLYSGNFSVAQRALEEAKREASKATADVISRLKNSNIYDKLEINDANRKKNQHQSGSKSVLKNKASTKNRGQQSSTRNRQNDAVETDELDEFTLLKNLLNQ